MGCGEFRQEDLEAVVAPDIWERGWRYYHQGQVISTYRMGSVWAGQVVGNGRIYQARLWWGERGLQGECDCPYQGFCKHLTAVALEWVHHREGFVDLEPKLERILKDDAGLADFVRRFVGQNLFGFAKLVCDDERRTIGFATNRSLVNAARNLFHRPVLTPHDAEFLWEQLAESLALLSLELPKANPEVLETLRILLSGVREGYQNFPDPLLSQSLQKLVVLISRVPQYYLPLEFAPLCTEMLDGCFDPLLWEVSDGFRRGAIAFLTEEPTLLKEYFDFRKLPSQSLFIRMARFELMYTMPQELLAYYRQEFFQAEQELLESEEGILWLADRLTESEPMKARRLARVGLAQALPERKFTFRERLIRLHHLAGEAKQAAALSYIQFTTEPGFEEYLRLKNLLASPHPSEWNSYLTRLREFLTERDDWELLLRIALDLHDCDWLIHTFDRITGDPHLLHLAAQGLAGELFPEFVDYYPSLITALVQNQQGRSFKGELQKLTFAFKRICEADHRTDLWEECCRMLAGEIPGGLGRMLFLDPLLDTNESAHVWERRD